MAKHNDVGRVGELVATEYLESKSLSIVDRNWSKPYGEIDIVARETSGLLHFVEVKTVSWETANVSTGAVPHETIRPEENVHIEKLKRLSRVIQSYLVSHGTEDDWQFDVIAIFLDQKSKKAKVRWLQDVVL